jgi:ACS family hexuronate transporter-like MFS transporter
VSGIVVDQVSVRWVYPLVVLGWSAAGVLTGYANGFVWLFACRVALGLFEAGNWPCGIRTTRAVLRPEERSFGNSLFQSGTAVGAIITPTVVLVIVQQADAAAPGPGPDPQSWKLPFKIIGWIGVVWVAFWFLTVPARLLKTASQPLAEPNPGASRYRDIFLDRRFWAVLGLVIAINIAWHTYRVWLPKYLQRDRDYTEAGMTALMTWFYLLADIGSWTVGLMTLIVARRGYSLHGTRLLMLLACSGLALTSLVVPFAPTGLALKSSVLVFAFASLGLFPTYFALSQELSSIHQGKVSGTLGATAHLFLSLVVYPIQGYVIEQTGSYDLVLAVAGLFPLLATLLLGMMWRTDGKS